MAPRSEREERILSGDYDNHVFDEVRKVLQSAVDDDYEITQNMSVSPAAAFGDMTVVFFTAAGDMSICPPRGVPGFSAVLHYPIRWVRKYFEDHPQVGVREGDCFMFNDTAFGGLHNADQAAFMPVFHEGELVCWATCAMHHGEDGAVDPGGMGPNVESVWDEGLRISPVLIARNYEVRADWLNMLQHGCRDKRLMGSDIKTRLGSVIRMEKRLKQVIAEYGVDNVVGALRQRIESVAEEAHRRIAEWPEGSVSDVLFADSTLREDMMAKLQLRLTKKDGKATIDMRGSSPALANRPINMQQGSAKAGIIISLTLFMWPDMPRINAVLEPFEMLFDECSMVNAGEDIPCSMGMQPLFKTISLMHQCMVKLTFSMNHKYTKPMAPWFNQPNNFLYGGITQHNEVTGNMCADINGMAGGARWDSDGESSMTAIFAAGVDMGETEFNEGDLPFVQWMSRKLLKDNCSPGKYRGGSGNQVVNTKYDSPFWSFCAFSGGSLYPAALGLFGGYASPCYPLMKIKGVDAFEALQKDPSQWKDSCVEWMNDQSFEGAQYITQRNSMPFEECTRGEFYMSTSGSGAGYGDVLERDPEAIMEDIRADFISHEAAAKIYKVVYDQQTLVVDVTATKALRDSERKARIARSKPFAEFIEEFVTDGPDAALPYLGSWDNDVTETWILGQKMPSEQRFPAVFRDPKDVEIEQLKSQIESMEGK